MSTADHQQAEPALAQLLTNQGLRWRAGRSVGRTLYIQLGDEASKDDLMIGTMDSPALAAFVVYAVNRMQERREDAS